MCDIALRSNTDVILPCLECMIIVHNALTTNDDDCTLMVLTSRRNRRNLEVFRRSIVKIQNAFE